jgi:hypothetical protein
MRSKCEFWLSKVGFLGHIVFAEGVAVDPSKVASITEWESPKNAGDIQSFLGLAGYYRRFIENFSKIAKPMTELLKKDKKFEWTDSCEASFQELKKRLVSAVGGFRVTRTRGTTRRTQGFERRGLNV